MFCWLANILNASTGMPIEEVHFFICQVLSIVLGFALRRYIPPAKSNIYYRHAGEIVAGFTLMYACYGYQMVHLLIQAIPAYLMMVFLPSHLAQYGVLVFTMAYLSFAHIQRMFSADYRNQTVDITAPLMIQTQKLSSLAFNLYDGDVLAKGRNVFRQAHKLHAISGRPKLVQLLSYLLCYQNAMVGPFVFYTDYLCFIEGREEDQCLHLEDRELASKYKHEIRNPKGALKREIISSVFQLILLVHATGRFKPNYLTSEEFKRLGFFRKYFWMSVCCFYFRLRFYFAWSVSAAAMLSAGFGFSGFKPGTAIPEYKNAVNIRFFDIELGTSTKKMFDAWNIGTTRWLRECVYDRVPKQFSVTAVFFTSAFWHGFYPVYYVCFLSAALVTHVGRLCRNRLRPYFVDNYLHHCFYHLLTHLSAMFCLNYLAVGFIFLNITQAMTFWSGFYFLGQLGPMLVLFLLPYALPAKPLPLDGSKQSVVDFSCELKLDPTLSVSATSSTTSASDMRSPSS